MKTARILLALAALPVFACGGKPAESPTPEVTPTATATATKKNGPSMQAELGSVDKKAVQRAFDGAAPALLGCFTAATKRVEVLSGDVKFFVRIAHDGSTRYAYIEGGDLGDREAEKCMLGALGKVTWPTPEDGDEAEAHVGTGFDVHDTRPANAWGPEKIPASVVNGKGLAACVAGGKGLSATVYVEADGKKGRIRAAGVTAGSKEAAEKADCVANALVGAETASPGGWWAKATIPL